MAIPNQIVFGLLLFEIATFIVLIVPLPFTWRRALFKAIAESQLVAKAQYALKITFIFVFLLFADAVNHMLKIQREGVLNKQLGQRSDLRGESDYRSRKFLSERNFYLHGFTLFLSLILSRTYSLVLDLIKAQEDLALLKKANAGGGLKGSVGAGDEQLRKEYEDLSKRYDELVKKSPVEKKQD
ncbi:BQ5605_C006g03909 [Microbotryum silenes-dioicae]|uniref:Endoplasmic reticulum transmembrane protein n=1 Tax=Microbotryum silenes-dioicae TaxID=796604 RepID=A0A2X0M5D1_9BASI|nr:BQ5605_C006g03909 [Microbotryum silenes-dioicae]